MNDRFNSYICKHVFGRIKIQIYDCQGDEAYVLDMPPDVYKELKRLIKEFERVQVKNDLMENEK